MALKGRYSYLYGLQTDALANDSKTNGIDKEATETSSGGVTPSDDESGLEVSGESINDSAIKSLLNGEIKLSTQSGDISGISTKIDIQIPNGIKV